MAMGLKRPSRSRGSPYPPRICRDCGVEFVPRRVDGSSPRARCDQCFEVWRKGLEMRRDER